MKRHYYDGFAKYRLTHVGGQQTLVSAYSPLEALSRTHKPAIRIEVKRMWGWDILRNVWW